MIPPADYLPQIRALCDRAGLLLMVDEVQTGMGRTGTWFGFQHAGIRPDVVSLAKGLGNGFPIGACLAGGAAASVLQPGTHGSTFGGNPLAARVAYTVCEVLEATDLPARAGALGAAVLARFSDRLGSRPGVVDIRGKGLMIGIELDRPCGELVGKALANGLLINVTAERVVRLLPPLVMSDDEAAEMVDGVSALIETLLDEAASPTSV